MRTSLALILLLVCASITAEELKAVVLNSPRINNKGELRILPNDHGVKLEKYGIEVRFFWQADEKNLKREATKAGISIPEFRKRFADKFKPLDKTFINALSKAKFLYVAQYSGAVMDSLWEKPEYAEAVRNFLKSGGTLFMDLFSVQPSASKLLASVTVANPWLTYTDYSNRNKGLYKAVPDVVAIKHPLLNFPHKIRGRQKGCDCYSLALPSQLPLFVKETSPDFPAMLLQEKVLGKGRVIFCQIPAFFRNPAQNVEAGKMLENILSYVYGFDIRKEALRKLQEDGGPGEDI
jgi:hypothetical protein